MEPSQPYHVAHEGDRVGPWPVEEIRRRLSAGELSPNDLAWREGMTDWEPLHKLLMPEDTAALPTSISGQSLVPEAKSSRESYDSHIKI